jgi:hypothetical protein
VFYVEHLVLQLRVLEFQRVAVSKVGELPNLSKLDE